MSDFLSSHQAIVSLKGAVHPKMKLYSPFTHTQVVLNLYIRLLLNTRQDIQKNVGKSGHSHLQQEQTLTSFVQQKKETRTGLDQVEDEEIMTLTSCHFHFQVNYPFKPMYYLKYLKYNAQSHQSRHPVVFSQSQILLNHTIIQTIGL